MNRNPQRLVIVSHVIHHMSSGQIFAYGPYAREIDIWADLFTEVVIAAPCSREAPAGDCLPITRSNVSLYPQLETGGDTLSAKAAQFLALPAHVWNLSRALFRADAVHVRCPGNLGLIGVIIAPLFSRRLIAKYAGQWNDYSGEPWTWRLQKKILRSVWWRGPVTVYGQWPNQPAKVVPFFTSILTAEQIDRARAAVTGKTSDGALRVIYVGRLTADKNVSVLLAALAELKQQGLTMQCKILGEGPERQSLEDRTEVLGLRDCVDFAGGVEFGRVLEAYENADVLVLASQTEGWPKAISEGMAFGLVCIGSNCGLVPEMLGDGRGIIVPPGDVDALTAALKRITVSPEDYKAMRTSAAAWAQEYSLEGLREALRALLTARWQLRPDFALPLTNVRQGVLNS